MAEEKKGFFKRLVSGLAKTRDNIVAGFDSILLSRYETTPLASYGNNILLYTRRIGTGVEITSAPPTDAATRSHDNTKEATQ